MIPAYTKNGIRVCRWLIDHGYTDSKRTWNPETKPTIVDKDTIDLLVREGVLKEESSGHYFVNIAEFDHWSSERIKERKKYVIFALAAGLLVIGLVAAISVIEYFFSG